MSRGTLDPAAPPSLSPTGLSPSLAGFPKTILLGITVTSAVRTPGRSRPGLGSSAFARRYLRNRCFFLFLRLLRCFSSPGSPPCVMDSRMDTGGLLQSVSPFRYLRIDGYLLLPEAFRSLSRLSSALSAKASTLRPSCLTIICIALHTKGFSFWSFVLRSLPAACFIACLNPWLSATDLSSDVL